MIKNFSFDLLGLGDRISHIKNPSLDEKASDEKIDNYFKRTGHRRIESSRPQKLLERVGLEKGSEHIATESGADANIQSPQKTSHRSLSNSALLPAEKRVKRKENKSVAANPEDKKQMLKLRLLIGEKFHVLELNVAGKSTRWLRERVAAYLNTIESASGSQFWLVSLSENYFLDEFLHSSDRSLSSLRETTVELEVLKQGSPLFNLQSKSLKDFRLLKLLGLGGFSKKKIAPEARRLEDGNFFALKLVDLEFVESRNYQHILMNERNILADAKHPFIITLHHAFKTKNHLVFVLDFCPGGELFYHLRKIKRMTESTALFYFIQICLGIRYLHASKVIYRDLKPENILVAADGYIKIIDFGLSRPEFDPGVLATTFCGSAEYMPPEMITKAGHGFQLDFYCLGALLYELLTGLPPFYSKDAEEIFKSALADPITFPEDIPISARVKDLIRRLMAKDPLKRLGSSERGIDDVLCHAALSAFSIDDIMEKRLEAPLKPNAFEEYFDPLPEASSSEVYDKITEDLMFLKLRKKDELSQKWKQFLYNCEKRGTPSDGSKNSRGAAEIQTKRLIINNKSAEFSLKYQEDLVMKNKSFQPQSLNHLDEPKSTSPEKLKAGSYRDILRVFNKKTHQSQSRSGAIHSGKPEPLSDIIAKKEIAKVQNPAASLTKYLANNKGGDKQATKIGMSMRLSQEDRVRLQELIRKKIPQAPAQKPNAETSKSITLFKPDPNNSFYLAKLKENNNKLVVNPKESSESPPILGKNKSQLPPQKEKLAQKFLAENFKSKLISFVSKNHRLPILNQSKMMRNESQLSKHSDNSSFQEPTIKR